MLLGPVSGQPFDALLDHADGPRVRVFVVHILRAAGRSDVEQFLVLAEE